MHTIDSGNAAAAMGVKLSRAQVIAAYPITPQTPLTEKLSEYVESGEMEAQYVPVESEHSALSVCIAASSAGSRAFTATSANGLLYMHEQIHWAAGARLPLVMCVVNRGVGAPWTVWNDHQDSISQRDTGWIQLYASDHQQIIDTVIQAYKLAEEVRIPVMVCYDGYILSHTYMPFDVPDEKLVDKFLGPFTPAYALDPNDPANLNTVTMPEVRKDIHGKTAHGYMEIRYLLQEDMQRAVKVANTVNDRYKKIFGRGDDPYTECYRTEDASFIAVCLGSLSYHLRDVIDELREEGIKVGVMGVRMFRPFPGRQIAEKLEGAEGVIVFEKALSYGNEGPLTTEIRSALFDLEKRPFIRSFILGLGGRQIRTHDLKENLKKAIKKKTRDSEPSWIGLKI